MNNLDLQPSSGVNPCACALTRLIRLCFRRPPALYSSSSRLPSQDCSAHQLDAGA